MKISVIICTLNRGDLASRLVASLLAEQTYGDFEIVVVDQNDRPCPESFRDASGKNRVKYVPIETKGLPNARNVGMAHAEGEIFVFLDDDVAPDAGLLGAHASNYRDKTVGGVAGRIRERKSLSNASKPGGRVTRSGRVLMNYESLSREENAPSACGGNMSFSRAAAEKTGEFDPGFDGISLLEETDYCYRVRAAGYRIVYDPEAALDHLRAETGGCRSESEKEALRARFRNVARFYRKHMNAAFLPYVFTVHFFIALKKTAQGRIGVKDFFPVLAGFFQGLGGYRRR